MTTETTRRYALIGTGSRGVMYREALTGDHADSGELVALADVNEGRLALSSAAVEAAGLPRPAAYHPDELERMIASERIDRVIITSPDFTHADLVVRALLAGADVVVEKPLTIDSESARAIAGAVERSGRSVVMTFNYRYSPRNSALREVIADGSIGTVTQVHFEWALDTSHGADYFRRWHRDKANSGGLLIHKSSHHFDLVNWWIDGEPRRVFASGGLRFYGDENAATRRLGERPERGSLDGHENDPFSLDLRTNEGLKSLYYDNEHFDGYRRDLDVFSAGITIEDNLSLVVDYSVPTRTAASAEPKSASATMSYSLNAHSPWEGYRVSITGTEGRAELTVVERSSLSDFGSIDPSANPEHARDSVVRPEGAQLIVQRHWEDAVIVPIREAEGRHGGADELLLHDVFRGVVDDQLGRAADFRDGIRAISVGIAGNESLRTGNAITVDPITGGEHQAATARTDPSATASPAAAGTR